jgi:hypothetical protein
MNEKIKELALQAGGSHYPDVGGKTLEKFAELIVRECMAICVSNALDEMDSDHPTTSAKSAFDIKQHFGLDE